MTDLTTAPLPLTTLSRGRRDCSGARSAISPRARFGRTCTRWTRRAQFNADIIPKFFELGLMGIEIPEQFGGAGGNIFLAVLAIEELARVDASAAIYVDVHNTLVNNCVLRWGNDEQQRATCRASPTATARRLRALGAGQRQRRLRPRNQRRAQGRRLGADRPEVLDHQRRRGGVLHRLRQHRLLQGLQGDHRVHRRAGLSRVFASARRRTSSASAPPARPS